MPIIATRKVIRFGTFGLVVTVPSGWARFYHLRPGSKVEVLVNDEIIIRPVDKGDKGAEKTQVHP